LKKTSIIFAFLSLYIIAAFAWWTYAHIRDNRIISGNEEKMMEMLCYKATIDVNGAIGQEMFNDTAGVNKFFTANYPQLEIIFDTNSPYKFDSFMIRPKQQAYEAISRKLQRKIWMYSTEGVAMALLLFWGIIWIYRSFQNRIYIKRRQSNFLLSITHELKTPLASIKLYLETMKKRKLDAEQTETVIKNSLHDVERLHDLVENLLLAAQLDNHKYEPALKNIDLSDLVIETVDKFALPRRLHHTITKNIEEGIKLNADSNALIMVLNNLLSNAAKYSPENSTIDVELRSDSNRVILSVGNEGKSIPEEDRKNLFTQFYRSGDENTRRSKGTGLGLFIVKNLLNLHHAEIHVRNGHTQGTVFDIIFKNHV
jgi:signal transduction histidine kinase